MFENCRKARKPSTILPDVIGTWKYGNLGDPGRSSPDDGFVTGAHELQPVTTPATDLVYLVVSEETVIPQTPPETTVITAVDPLPQIQSKPRISQAEETTVITPVVPLPQVDRFGTGAHELQPVTTSATDSVYLVVSEENAMLPTEETTVITPVDPLPQVQSNPRTSILVDPTSPTDRRNSKAQVCQYLTA